MVKNKTQSVLNIESDIKSMTENSVSQKKSNDDLTTLEIKELIDLYFRKKNILYSFHYDSYNYLIEQLTVLLENNNFVLYEREDIDGFTYRYSLTFKNVAFVSLREDNVRNTNKLIFPETCRMNHQTYSGDLKALATIKFEKVDNRNGTITAHTKDQKSEYVDVARLPIMVKSKYCNTNSGEPHTECPYDTGCYFIIKGNEKILIPHERMGDNKDFVFTKKDSNFEDNISHFIQVNSKRPEDMKSPIERFMIKILKDKTLVVNMKYLNDIPLFIFFRALGFNTDKEIVNYIVGYENDLDMINLLQPSLTAALNETYKDDNENIIVIRTQTQAIKYLTLKEKSFQRYSTTDLALRDIQKEQNIYTIMKRDLLPHMKDNIRNKALYIANMTHKLLSCILKRIDPDDRDSYINKRLDLEGPLLLQLFKTNFQKMLTEGHKYFNERCKNEKEYQEIPPSSVIKPNIIEQGFNTALATGTFSTKQKGVAQTFGRLSYPYSFAYPRRGIAPVSDTTGIKMDKPRHVHQIQYGYFTAEETPEGENVGLHKHLALSASVSVSKPMQDPIILEYIRNDIILLEHITVPVQLKIWTKVYINGTWLGMIGDMQDDKKIEQVVNRLMDYRASGKIDKTVSICWHRTKNELRIYTDGGRVYRPLLVIKENQLVLTRKMIKSINKNTSFDEFLIQNPGIIEYVDIEESETKMVALTVDDLKKSYENMKKIIENPQNTSTITNRYSENIYVKYTNCELNPYLMLGSISCNIPFYNHNQAPRNYFNYSQARPAMGINATNMKYRTDTTYLLVNTALPIVQTWGSEYTKMNILPTGENSIVAIMMHTGYNQEDSLLMNLSSIQRGFMNAQHYTIYKDQLQKNPENGKNDIFTKPDINCTNRKHGNYDKLTAEGYPAEGTVVTDGDFIIGKVTPITGENNMKAFRDNSMQYKSNVDAIVDQVIKSQNIDNVGTLTIRVRSDRTPVVGDKFCCVCPETEALTTNGWKLVKDLTLGDKVATLQNGDTLEYHNPIAIQAYAFEGNMYYVDTNQINQLVTPNHRMYVGNRDGKCYGFKEAKDVYGKRLKYKKNVEKTDIKGLTKFVVPGSELVLPIDEWLWLFGIWIAEGWTTNGTQIMFAVDKQRVKDKLEEVICNTELSLVKTNYDSEKWLISSKELWNYLSPLKGAVNKYLPEWVWELSQEQCRTLISAMCLGDGHTMANGTRRYDTSSTKLADDFQRLCLHAGWSCNKKIKYKAGHESVFSNGYVAKATVDSYRLTITTAQNNPIVNKNIKSDGTGRNDGWYPVTLNENKDNNVFCCTVPGEGIFYIRRKGVVSWTGNSRMGQKGTVGMRITNADMPFTSHGIQPDIIINTCCFVGNSLISTPNGLSKRIDSFSDQGLEKVLTFNDKEGFINSFSLGLEAKGIKDTVNVTMADGRQLTCTPDHKFKVTKDGKFEYKEAKDLTQEDSVVMGLEFTEDKHYDDEQDWELELDDYKFSFKNNVDRERTLAFARILGYLSTDGTIHCSSKSCHVQTRINMGHLLDVESILDDIELVTNERPNYKEDHMTYNILLVSSFGKAIVKLDGLMNGRRTTQEATLPTFLLDDKCPKAFVREFLGGFFGGDGHAPYINKNIFVNVKLSQSIINKYKDTLVNKIQNIINLMKKIGVTAEIARIRPCHQKTKLYQDEPRLQCELTVKSNIEFLENIGFRHCLQKSARLSIAASFERYQQIVIKQTTNMLNKIDELIINENIGNKAALEKARKLNYQTEQPLNDYYSLLTLDFVNNRRRETRKNTPILLNHIHSPNARQYIEQLECQKWFSQSDDGKMIYVVKRGDNFIPYFTMKVNSVYENGKAEVYDIGVAEHHNFIIEGVAVSNCIPSRMTIGQLIETVISKAAALEGNFADGTPFQDVDMEGAYEILKKHGYNHHGLETMYCGYTGKKMDVQIFIGPTYYLRVKHMVLDKIHCTKPDHEVLTSTGWKFIPDITEKDKVAILKNDELVYEEPIKVLHFPDYEGKMYRIKNQAIDLDVTLNHRMYISQLGTTRVTSNKWQPYKLIEAGKIVGKQAKYKKDAEWNKPDYQFILPKVESHNGDYLEKVVDMDSWLTFFGIWMAEGWATFLEKSTHYLTTISVNKQRVKDVLYPAVTNLGFTYDINSEKMIICNKQLHMYMIKYSVGAPHKRLPEWCWELSQDQSKKLLHAMQLSDGSFSKLNSQSVYYTSSIGLADDFQKLCLHAGWSGIISKHLEAGNKNIIHGREVISNYDLWRISVIKTRNNPSVNHGHHKTQNVQEEEVYDYKGSVYCLEVSSEVFMVRRNGKTVWTGNSRSKGPTQILTRQPTEGRARDGGFRFGKPFCRKQYLQNRC